MVKEEEEGRKHVFAASFYEKISSKRLFPNIEKVGQGSKAFGPHFNLTREEREAKDGVSKCLLSIYLSINIYIHNICMLIKRDSILFISTVFERNA